MELYYGYWLGLLSNCKVKRILARSKHGHWRYNWVKSFRFLGFLGNGKKFSGEIFALCSENFRIFLQ